MDYSISTSSALVLNGLSHVGQRWLLRAPAIFSLLQLITVLRQFFVGLVELLLRLGDAVDVASPHDQQDDDQQDQQEDADQPANPRSRHIPTRYGVGNEGERKERGDGGTGEDQEEDADPEEPAEAFELQLTECALALPDLVLACSNILVEIRSCLHDELFSTRIRFTSESTMFPGSCLE